MRLKNSLKIIALCLIFQARLLSQISITNISVQPFNVVPEALLNIGIMNTGEEREVQLTTQIFSSNGSVIMTVKSQQFKLTKGLNSGLGNNRRVMSIDYAGSNQAGYIKTTHNLPSGRYKVCSSIYITGGADKLDEFCDEMEAEFNQYLYLVNPIDGDTIETKYPILSWTHSEPFTILNQGEFYRMVVTEVKKEQTAEEAVTVNSPVMIRNYLKEHQVQYPFDARELKEGNKYSWQVQKLGDGVVINKTEAWIFYTKNITEKKSLKYVAMKSEIDGSFYTAYNGKVYFKFSEEYKTQGNLKFSLLDAKSKSKSIDVDLDKEEYKKAKVDENSTKLKSSGDNRYEMNLDAKKLSSGFYTLIVKNEKNESFYLKIFLP